jgi:hypothetical protein
MARTARLPQNSFNIVLSWSGKRSRQVARAFRDWLPKVLQAAKPWMSETDTDKGTVWVGEIGRQLDTCRIGIVFVTRDNQDKPWLNFEAGALSKTVREQSRVCTVLLDGLRPSDISGPLSNFQHTNGLSRDEIQKLVVDLANAIDANVAEEHLRVTFEGVWSNLRDVLVANPALLSIAPERTDRDLIEELLERTRQLQRSMAQVGEHFQFEPDGIPQPLGTPVSLSAALESISGANSDDGKDPPKLIEPDETR